MTNREIETHNDEGEFNHYAIGMINKTFSGAIILSSLLFLFYLWGSISAGSNNIEFFSTSTSDVYFAAAISGFSGLLFSFCRWLMARGQVQIAIRIFVFFIILIFVVAVFSFQTGIYDPITDFVFLSLVITSVFLGRRSLILIAACGVAFNFIIFYLIQNGSFITNHKALTFDDVIVDSSILLLTTAILVITVNQILKNRKELVRYQTHLEEIVAERTAQYHAERDRAEAANQAKGQFLANMSHELRTPLNAIIGYSELIKEGLADPNLKEDDEDDLSTDIEKIEASGRHLLELINNILDLSKIDTGKADLNVGYHSLATIIDKVVFTIEPQVLSKGVQFDVVYDKDAFQNELIHLDKLKTQQVLINLLANAVKFTEQGKIELRIEKAQLEGQLNIRFTVSDTGIGIDPEFIPHLFNRFEQEDNSLTRKHDGTGLGLAICSQLVEMMKGSITMDSVKGVGSIFFITLPTSVIPIDSESSATEPLSVSLNSD